MKHSQSEKWEDLWQNANGLDDTGYSLYVSNLALSVTARDLKKLFEKIGSLISVNVILNPESGESRGYGFVDYLSLTDRERARRDLHGKDLFGKKIRVSRSCGKCTLYVGNLPSFINDIGNDSDAEKMISDKLHVISKGIPIRRIRKRKNYNYGFVEYENHRQAQAALISLRNANWDNHELRVEIATSNIKYDEYEQIMNDESRRQKNGSGHHHGGGGGHGGHGHHGGMGNEMDEKRRTLYIKNLDKSTTDHALKCLFEKYGKLTRCLIIRDVPSRKLNYGFIQFEAVQAAEKAYYEVHGNKLNGVTLHIEFSKSLPGERKKRLISTDVRGTNHLYARGKLSKNDERNKNLHFNLNRSRSRSPPSVSRSRSRSRGSRHSRSRSSEHTMSVSPSHSASSRSPTHRHHRRHHRRHHHHHHRHRSRSRGKYHHKKQMKKEKKGTKYGGGGSRREDHNKIPMTTTTTISSHRNRERKPVQYPKYPLCVNLPIEYNMNHNKNLIGFDINQHRYILFRAYKTSSSLNKLQSDSRSESPSASRSRSRSKEDGHNHKTSARGRRKERDRERTRHRNRKSNKRNEAIVSNSKSPSKSSSSSPGASSGSNSGSAAHSKSRSPSNSNQKSGSRSRSRSVSKSRSPSKTKENSEVKENNDVNEDMKTAEENLQNNTNEDIDINT